MINRPTVPTIYPPGAQAWFALVGAVADRMGAGGPARRGGRGGGRHDGVIARWLGRDRGRAALRRQPADHDRGRQRRTPGRAGGAWRSPASPGVRCVGGTGSPASSSGWRPRSSWCPCCCVPVPAARGRWRTSLTAVGDDRRPATSRTSWWSARWCSATCPGYWSEEGYGAGGRFALLAWLPADVRTPVALTHRRRAGGHRRLSLATASPVLVTCTWLYGASFLVATPIYPWYAMPLLVLASDGAALGVVGGLVGRLRRLRLRPRRSRCRPLAYGLALIIVLVAALLRRRVPAMSDPPASPRTVVIVS